MTYYKCEPLVPKKSLGDPHQKQRENPCYKTKNPAAMEHIHSPAGADIYIRNKFSYFFLYIFAVAPFVGA